jgi:hypothetical protein
MLISKDGNSIITKKEILCDKEFVLLNISTNYEEDNKSIVSYLTKQQAEKLIDDLTLAIRGLES